MIIAAYVGLFVLALLTIFQISLILGAPFGRLAWGGQHKILPTKLRVSSASSLIIYGVFAAFLMSKSGVWAVITNQPILQVGMWAMTIYFALGVLLNAISRSKPERYTMTPVALTFFVCFLLVALG